MLPGKMHNVRGHGKVGCPNADGWTRIGAVDARKRCMGRKKRGKKERKCGWRVSGLLL